MGSRSHASPDTASYLARLGRMSMSGIGSSLKFCLIAEGKADLYPRFGPTSEWDTAAGQALLEAAGGHVTRLDGHRLRYNCRETLINGDFLAFNDPSVLPPPETRSHRTASSSPLSRALPPRTAPSVASSRVGISNTTSFSAKVSRATPAAAMSAAGTCSRSRFCCVVQVLTRESQRHDSEQSNAAAPREPPPCRGPLGIGASGGRHQGMDVLHHLVRVHALVQKRL